MFFHKKSPHHPACLAFHVVAAVFLGLASIVSLVGVIMAHYDVSDGSLIFGTSAASLSLLAFGVCITLLLNQCKSCMEPCAACAMPAKKK